MRQLSTLACCLLFACGAFAADNTLTEGEKADGWKLLFDGTSTTGWVNRGKGVLETTLVNWKAENGTLMRSDKGGDAVYGAEQFENFVLSIDWKIADKGNSGVFIRLSDIKDWINTGAEVQILDINEEKEMSRPTHIAGSLYDLVGAPDGVRMKPGTWNNFIITCDGSKINTVMNGTQSFAVDLTEEKWKSPQGKFKIPMATLPRKGYLMFQDHGALVEFKNIKIKPLP